MPDGGRACAMCFAEDSMVYIVGGRLQDGSFSSTILVYNTLTDQWNTKNPPPITPRVNGTVCTTSQGVYLGLGWANGYIHTDSLYLRDWWHYTPCTNTWTRLADFPSDKTAAAVSWSDDQYIWVTSGFHGYTNEVWRYDIDANSWSLINPPTPQRVMSPIAAVCNGRYFYGTGFYNYSRSDWWEWFPDGSWERRSSLPGKGRHNAACSATSKSVWVFGGWHYGDSLTTGFYYEDILRYTPYNDQWTYCGTIPCGTTENGVACAVGDQVYFGLGEDKHGKIHPHWYRIDE